MATLLPIQLLKRGHITVSSLCLLLVCPLKHDGESSCTCNSPLEVCSLQDYPALCDVIVSPAGMQYISNELFCVTVPLGTLSGRRDVAGSTLVVLAARERSW